MTSSSSPIAFGLNRRACHTCHAVTVARPRSPHRDRDNHERGNDVTGFTRLSLETSSKRGGGEGRCDDRKGWRGERRGRREERSGREERMWSQFWSWKTSGRGFHGLTGTPPRSHVGGSVLGAHTPYPKPSIVGQFPFSPPRFSFLLSHSHSHSLSPLTRIHLDPVVDNPHDIITSERQRIPPTVRACHSLEPPSSQSTPLPPRTGHTPQPRRDGHCLSRLAPFANPFRSQAVCLHQQGTRLRKSVRQKVRPDQA